MTTLSYMCSQIWQIKWHLPYLRNFWVYGCDVIVAISVTLIFYQALLIAWYYSILCVDKKPNRLWDCFIWFWTMGSQATTTSSLGVIIRTPYMWRVPWGSIIHKFIILSRAMGHDRINRINNAQGTSCELFWTWNFLNSSCVRITCLPLSYHPMIARLRESSRMKLKVTISARRRT